MRAALFILCIAAAVPAASEGDEVADALSGLLRGKPDRKRLSAQKKALLEAIAKLTMEEAEAKEAAAATPAPTPAPTTPAPPPPASTRDDFRAKKRALLAQIAKLTEEAQGKEEGSAGEAGEVGASAEPAVEMKEGEVQVQVQVAVEEEKAEKAEEGEAPSPTVASATASDKDKDLAEKAAQEAEAAVERPKVNAAFTVPFQVAHARVGLPVAVELDGEATPCTLDGPYNDDVEELAGGWWVTCGEERHVRPVGALAIHLLPGLEVISGAATGVVTAQAAGEPAKLLVKVEGKGEEVEWGVDQVTLPTDVYKVKEGDRVDVRDSEDKSWKTGVVTKDAPAVLVKVLGWKKAFAFKHIRLHQRAGVGGADAAAAGRRAAPGAAKFVLGQRVEVRDDEKQWKLGQVVEANGLASKVLVDGWKKPHVWKNIRSAGNAIQNAEPAEAAAASEEAAPATKPVDANDLRMAGIQEAWSTACSSATCANAGKDDDDACTVITMCDATPGCAWDEFESPPCQKRLKLGDSVALAPGAHEQGSLLEGEVGVIMQVWEGDEQPYSVRGGYSDVFRYRADEVVPAWGNAIKWVHPAYHNPILRLWRGAASFGKAAEELEGAAVDNGFKTPAPENWGTIEGAAPAGGAPAQPPAAPPAQPPAAPPAQPPAAPPVPVAQPPPEPAPAPVAAVPPAAPATGGDAAPPVPPAAPPVPVPAAPRVPITFAPKAPVTPRTYRPPVPRTPKPFVAITAPPKVYAPPVITVYAPEIPDICGNYKEQPKSKNVRGMPLYISEDCATGDCSMFQSHGGFWMVGRSSEDAKGNRGVFKSTEKTVKVGVKKTLPHVMAKWEYLQGMWGESEGMVAEPEKVKEKGFDPTMCMMKKMEEAAEEPAKEEEAAAAAEPKDPEPAAGGDAAAAAAAGAAGGGADAPSGVEKRLDDDFAYYTKAEFAEYYKTDDKWDSRAPFSNMRLVKGAAVMSLRDVAVSGTVVVKKSTAGTISALMDGDKYLVVFKGDGGHDVSVPVEMPDIGPA